MPGNLSIWPSGESSGRFRTYPEEQVEAQKLVVLIISFHRPPIEVSVVTRVEASGLNGHKERSGSISLHIDWIASIG